jgi:hypothetical protein
VHFSDGREEVVNFEQLLPETGVGRTFVFRTAFGNDKFLIQPETVDWLRYRLEQLFPNEDISGIDIRWSDAEYDIDNDRPVRYIPDSQIHVHFNDSE